MNKYLSIVVPVYNEVDNLKLLNNRIKEILEPQKISYEVIYVDDCSKDGSYEVLKELAQSADNIKVVKFRRNFGQTAAMTAGFDYAEGEIIVPLDADLQNDPQDIPAMIDKYKEGYDIVSGWRKSRKDNIIRKIPSQIANKLISKLTGVYLHDYGCSLKVYNAEVLKNIRLYGELHRFIPAIAAIYGAEVVEMPVNHHPRVHGVSKYNLSRTFKVFLDLLTIVFLKKYLTRPMHVFGRMALGVFAIVFAALLLLLANVIVPFMPVDYPMAIVLITMLSIFGIQLLGVGIVAELITRTYHETSGKKIYTVDKVLNLE